jgi:hypothetical protein
MDATLLPPAIATAEALGVRFTKHAAPGGYRWHYPDGSPTVLLEAEDAFASRSAMFRLPEIAVEWKKRQVAPPLNLSESPLTTR